MYQSLISTLVCLPTKMFKGNSNSIPIICSYCVDISVTSVQGLNCKIMRYYQNVTMHLCQNCISGGRL